MSAANHMDAAILHKIKLAEKSIPGTDASRRNRSSKIRKLEQQLREHGYYRRLAERQARAKLLPPKKKPIQFNPPTKYRRDLLRTA